ASNKETAPARSNTSSGRRPASIARRVDRKGCPPARYIRRPAAPDPAFGQDIEAESEQPMPANPAPWESDKATSTFRIDLPQTTQSQMIPPPGCRVLPVPSV